MRSVSRRRSERPQESSSRTVSEQRERSSSRTISMQREASAQPSVDEGDRPTGSGSDVEGFQEVSDVDADL